MIPGPTLIYKCPKCDNIISNESLMSGNTFGATLFSDGKYIKPHLPEFPNLTICSKCDNIFWLSDTKELGSTYWNNLFPKDWSNAVPARFLTIAEYFKAIESAAKNPKEELIIRIRIWWEYNDRTRIGESMFLSDADKMLWKGNIEKLLMLLDATDVEQKLMIAELYRNLGNFEKCLDILNSIADEGLDWFKSSIKRECNALNTLVVQVEQPQQDTDTWNPETDED